MQDESTIHQNPENTAQITPESEQKPSPEQIKFVYEQLCNSYRAIDDFRTKLLGFLPLATGGIFLLIPKPANLHDNENYMLPIGIFGFAVALGLFFFELYGIKKCTFLIGAGKALEAQMGQIKGQFTTRPDGVLGFISEPLAAGIIYPAVLAAWSFLAFYHPDCQLGVLAAVWVFTVGLFVSILFICWLKDHAT
jgi:hypothetical protein